MKLGHFIVWILFPAVVLSQHSISGTFSPPEDYTFAFLYKSTPDGANYIDRAQTDREGNFKIELDSLSEPGIYKIVYAIPPEENNFDIIYNGKEDVVFTFSLDDGIAFTKSKENILWANYVESIQTVNSTISNFYESESKNKKEFGSVFKTLNDTQKAYESDSKDMIAQRFVKANQPYIPTNFEDANTYSKNLKANFLKHIDFADKVLQSSDFLVDRVNSYVFDIIANPTNENYQTLIDELDAVIGEQDNHFKSILYTNIWQRFVKDNNTEMALYITNKYLLSLAEGDNNQPLLVALSAYKNTAIGAKAVNFDIPIHSTNLHAINTSSQYLLVFWSSSCSHCLKELPQVKTLIENNNDIQVIAIGIEDDEVQWQQEVAKYPSFVHKVELNKWDSDLVKAYNIKSTPSYFLLNSNKFITDKPYDFEALKRLLEEQN